MKAACVLCLLVFLSLSSNVFAKVYGTNIKILGTNNYRYEIVEVSQQNGVLSTVATGFTYTVPFIVPSLGASTIDQTKGIMWYAPNQQAPLVRGVYVSTGVTLAPFNATLTNIISVAVDYQSDSLLVMGRSSNAKHQVVSVSSAGVVNVVYEFGPWPVQPSYRSTYDNANRIYYFGNGTVLGFFNLATPSLVTIVPYPCSTPRGDPVTMAWDAQIGGLVGLNGFGSSTFSYFEIVNGVCTVSATSITTQVDSATYNVATQTFFISWRNLAISGDTYAVFTYQPSTNAVVRVNTTGLVSNIATSFT